MRLNTFYSAGFISGGAAAVGLPLACPASACCAPPSSVPAAPQADTIQSPHNCLGVHMHSLSDVADLRMLALSRLREQVMEYSCLGTSVILPVARLGAQHAARIFELFSCYFSVTGGVRTNSLRIRTPSLRHMHT